MSLKVEDLDKKLTEILKVTKNDPYKSTVKQCIEEIYPEKKEQLLNDFFEENKNCKKLFISLLEIPKLPNFFIDFIFLCVSSNTFDSEDIISIIDYISNNSWSTSSKTKILQMSFYFIKFDLNQHLLTLFNFIISNIINNDQSLESAARPIITQIINSALHSATSIYQSKCDMDCPQALDNQPFLNHEKEEINESCTKSLESLSTNQLIMQSQSNNISDPIINLKHGSMPMLYDNNQSESDLLIQLLFSIIKLSSNLSLSMSLISIILKHKSIFLVPGFENFVKENFFSFFSEILKKGKQDDKNLCLETILFLQLKNFNNFYSELILLYQDLPQWYNFFNKSEIFFNIANALISDLKKSVLCDSKNTFVSEDDSQLIFIKINDLILKTSEDSNFNKKSNQKKIDFLSKMIHIIDLSEENCISFIESILYKIDHAGHLEVNLELFYKNSIDFAVKINNRSLFTAVIESACLKKSQNTVYLALQNKHFMKDEWNLILGSSNENHLDLSILFNNINTFDHDEFFCFLNFIKEKHAIETFEQATKKFMDQNNTEFVKILLSKISNVNLLSTILIKYYSALNIGKIHSYEEEDIDLSQFTGEFKEEIEFMKNSKKDLSVLIEESFIESKNHSKLQYEIPLQFLEDFVNKNNELFSEVMKILPNILKIVEPRFIFPVVFSIMNTKTGCFKDKIPLILIIVEDFLDCLSDELIFELLHVIRDMSISSYNDSVLNSLFIYHEIGEYLITKKFININEISDYTADKANISPIWKEYLVLGVDLASDERSFVSSTAFMHLFDFIKTGYTDFSEIEREFLESDVFCPLYSIDNEEIILKIIEQMNILLSGKNLIKTESSYISYLSDQICFRNEKIEEKSCEGLMIFCYSEQRQAIANDFNLMVNDQEISNYNQHFNSSNTANTKFSENPNHLNSFITKKIKTINPFLFDSLIKIIKGSKTISSITLNKILLICPEFYYSKDQINDLLQASYTLFSKEELDKKNIVQCFESISMYTNHQGIIAYTLALWLDNESNDNKRIITESISRIISIKKDYSFINEILEIFIANNKCEESLEIVSSCIKNAYSNVLEQQDIDLLIKTLNEIFNQTFERNYSRQQERSLLEMLDFYNKMLEKKSAPKEKDFKLIVSLTTKKYKSIRLKAYQILFLHHGHIGEVLLSKMDQIMKSFSEDYACKGNSIESLRVIEVLYCLKSLALLGNKNLLDKLKNQLVDLMICQDFDILFLIRKCFKVLFSP